MGPGVVALGIGSILGNVFGNLFGANKQASAAERAAHVQARTAKEIAEMETAAADKQLAYLQGIEERDYSDWLSREARDRRDWEASEQRRQPFRALADSAIRTLADYIKVPGMKPAQDVPVQVWSDPRATAMPRSTAMPVDPRMAQPQPTQMGGFVSPQRRTLLDFAR
jgi:hypothetical protein